MIYKPELWIPKVYFTDTYQVCSWYSIQSKCPSFRNTCITPKYKTFCILLKIVHFWEFFLPAEIELIRPEHHTLIIYTSILHQSYKINNRFIFVQICTRSFLGKNVQKYGSILSHIIGKNSIISDVIIFSYFLNGILVFTIKCKCK